MKPRLISTFLVPILCISLGWASQAAAQTALDTAKANADLQEALKRESDARTAIAKNQIDAANADAAARATLSKAQTDAEKSRSDYYQSLVPDPSKYKVAAPGAPKLNASAARRSFDEAASAARAITGELMSKAKALPPKAANEACERPVWILPGSSALATRSLITQSLSTEKALEQLESQIESSRDDLQQTLSEPRAAAGPIAFHSVAVAAAAVQAVLSIATVLKPQFAFDTSSQSTTSGSVLEAKVFGALAEAPCYAVVDTNALLSLLPLDEDGGTPEELVLLQAVRDQIGSARSDVRSALRASKDVKAKADGIRKTKGQEKTVADLDSRSARIESAAKALTDLANDAEKSLVALYTVDAQGASPIDAAVRGGMLRKLLAQRRDSTYYLTVKTIASDVDLAAKDGLFVHASTSLSSNTIVSWQMSSVNGRVVSAGSLSFTSPTEIKRVWPD